MPLLNEVLCTFVYPQSMPPKPRLIKNIEHVIKSIFNSRDEL